MILNLLFDEPLPVGATSHEIDSFQRTVLLQLVCEEKYTHFWDHIQQQHEILAVEEELKVLCAKANLKGMLI